MALPRGHDDDPAQQHGGWWNAEVDISRTPSPGLPAKRVRMALEDFEPGFADTSVAKDEDLNNLLRAERTPEALGYGTSAQSFMELWVSSNNSSLNSVRRPPTAQLTLQEITGDHLKVREKKRMQTGCIPCL